MPWHKNPIVVLAIAFVVGLDVALAALLGCIDGATPFAANVFLAGLVAGPLAWGISARLRHRPLAADDAPLGGVGHPARRCRSWSPWVLGLTVSAAAIGASAWVAQSFAGSLPCVHDEYSYLLQAATFLQGKLWFPSHPMMPDLFDQIHVLNEGKFASRYFPGTALWLAPFVAAGKPYLGQWLAGALVAALVFAAGRELAGDTCGFIAGIVTALAPGMATFSNLLVAHHATLLGLSLFLFSFFRMQNTGSVRWALAAGTGLAFAVWCRPLTAAAVAAPFAVWFVAWAARRIGSGQVLRTGIGLSLPVAVGLAALLFYNNAITGDPFKSPWQLYNEIYTPRHMYGFDNGARGNAHRGPKVVDEYDAWAANLTFEPAVDNLGMRLGQSWRWTLGGPPLAMAAVVVLFFPGPRRAGWLLLAAIAGLHAAYFPYWYAGIFGWHYVFESLPLWALAFALATCRLFDTWRSEGRQLLGMWWLGLAIAGPATMYLPLEPGQPSALEKEIRRLTAVRLAHAEFLRRVEREVGERPALVLVEQPLVNSFVVNSGGLDTPLIFGHYRPQRHSLDEIVQAFPERAVYLYDPRTRAFTRPGVPAETRPD